MYTVKLDAPGNQSDGVVLVQTIDTLVLEGEMIYNRRYLIYKDIVQSSTMNIGVSSFELEFQFENIFDAISISRMFDGKIEGI